MKIIRVLVEGLPLFEKELDISFLTESRVVVDERHELTHLFANFYLNKVIAFTGLNASGKTQTLNVLSFAVKLLQGKSINYKPAISWSDNDSNILNIKNNDKVTIHIYFFDENNKKIYQLSSTIVRKQDQIDNEYKYIITEEILKSKNISGIRSKNQIFNFDIQNVEIDIRNSQNLQYMGLSTDVSMLRVRYNSKNLSPIFYRDMLSFTNINILSGFGNLPKQLINFFDPSIDYLKFEELEDENDAKVQVKFKGDSHVVKLNSIKELNLVLSSGTVKGIGLFMNSISTLINGGIILIDELENHFNREIAATLMRWFSDSMMNVNNALLVYSTHYVELLDGLDRNDAVYLVSKKKGVKLERLSSVLKRNDLSKSVQLIKGVLENAAISYQSENLLRKEIISFLNLKNTIKENKE